MASFIRATGFLTLAALSGALTQRALAPIYSALPAAAEHQKVLIWVVVVAFMGKSSIKKHMPADLLNYLPVLAFWIPSALEYFSRDSTRLGIVNGPVATECLTYFPIVLFSAMSASDSLEAFRSFRTNPFLQAAAAGVSYLYISYGEALAADVLPQLFMASDFYNLINLQLMTAGGFALLAPSASCVLAIPAFAHITYMNPHHMSPYTTNKMNETLQANNWTLIDRRDSDTGYLSVLENAAQGYRVLRCDHSLLGGEWLVTEERRAESITVREPVYAVFEMLEAVRLVKGAGANIPDSDKCALVIGLGIGTAPKALLAHGIATTIIELDPSVHAFATQYFDLPSNHTKVFGDAVAWTANAVAAGAGSAAIPKTYDYIIHDVFTGGAEPLALFTLRFLSNLRALLAPSGVVAINYADDVTLQPTAQVLHTIDVVFEGRCRVFRDVADTAALRDADSATFSNMVIFCTNQDDGVEEKGLRFREPVEADYLGTQSRRRYLVPRPELEMRFPTAAQMEGLKETVLTEGNIKGFRMAQVESARKHWRIMREVVPAIVWETY